VCDIIRAEGALGVVFAGRETGLSCGRTALEFIAEVLKVFLANLQLQNFFDHRQEVRQRANRPERRRIGRPRQTSRRRKNHRIRDRFQRHAAFLQLSRQ